MQVLVLGASVKEERYSNMAVQLLKEKGHSVIAHGLRKGLIGDVEIQTQLDNIKDIHTVSLYLGPDNQTDYYEFIVNLNPQRVIFNPGTENTDFQQKLTQENIPWEEACTLVLLRTNQF